MKGKLQIDVVFVGPMDARKENRDRAPWGTRTQTVLTFDDITQMDANEVVTKMRAHNPGVEFRARWEGPVTL